MRLYSIAVLVGMTASGVIGQVGGCGSAAFDPLNPFESTGPIAAESESGDLRIVAEAFDVDDPLTVHFRAEAIDGSSPADGSVIWMFGDDTTDIGLEVIHTYPAEGDYYVQVTTDLAASKTASVTGVLLPVRTFKVTAESVPAAGEAPLTVQLSMDTSVPLAQEVITYRWDFDDGQFAEGDQSTEHVFTDPGRYKVRATVVTDAGWSRSGSVTVNVAAASNVSPEAVIDAWPTAGQAPLTVLFDGSDSSDGDGEVVSYLWQFGDGQSAGGPVVEHTYSNDGDYSATLTVIDDGGASNTAEVIVSVEAAGPGPNQPPIAAISADPTAGTAPLTVTLSASGSTDSDGLIESCLWDFGDGVSGAGVEVTHTYADAGDYTVVLTVIDNDGGSDQAAVAIHVNGEPTASFVMDPQRDVAPVVVHFNAAASTDADGQIVHYRWDFDDGTVEEGPDKVTVDHTYAEGGAFLVRLTVTDDDGAIAYRTSWLALSELAVWPASVDFGDTGSEESIEVSNPGAYELQYNVAVDYGLGPDGWLSVSPAAGSCAAGQTTVLTIEDDRAALPAGAHSAEVQVRAGDVTRTVGVTIAVVAVATSIDSHDFGIDSEVCQFEIWNDGAGVLTCEVTSKPDWVDVSGLPATSSGPGDSKTVTLTTDRSGLAPGEHTGDLVLIPTGGQGDLGRRIPLTTSVASEAGALSVSPASGLSSSGTEGGPFSPGSILYTLTNSGTAAVAWTVDTSASWVDLSETGNILSPGSSVNVEVSISSQAASLATGTYSDWVTFTNTTNGVGTTTRSVSLTVNADSAGTMAAANRTTGVAPLAVFFDAVEAASGVLQPADGDYASLGYAWDFGDVEAGTWSTNGNSRNAAMGYVAAHVYEQPGTYTVTLTVTDTQGGTHAYQQEITVAAFSGTTYYVSSSSGSDGNTGLSPTAPLASFGAAMSKVRTNRRILFKRGDTWTTSDTGRIGWEGPGIIGAYYYSDGSDDRSRPKPHIVMTGDGSGVECGGPWASDWRIMDVRLSPDHASRAWGVSLGWEGAVRWLLLRVETDGYDVGIGCTASGTAFVENAVVECNVHDIVGIGIYLAGQRLAVLGTRITDMIESHSLRVWYTQKAVISENMCHYPGQTRQALKLHGYDLGQGPATEYVVVSANSFRGSTYVVAVAPENAESDEPVRHVVVERNVITPDAQTVVGLYLRANDVTVRNNIFDATGGATWYKAVHMEGGVGSSLHDIKVFNNTAYMGGSASQFRLCTIDSSAQDTVVRNNLASAPYTSDRQLIVGSGSGLVADHNLLTSAPGFVNAAAGDFRLLSGSPAVDAGTPVPWVFVDWDSAGRPRGNGYDIGAFER